MKVIFQDENGGFIIGKMEGKGLIVKKIIISNQSPIPIFLEAIERGMHMHPTKKELK